MCGVTETPEWRRGPQGEHTLCNACGLHYAKTMKKQKKERDSTRKHSIDMLLNENGFATPQLQPTTQSEITNNTPYTPSSNTPTPPLPQNPLNNTLTTNTPENSLGLINSNSSTTTSAVTTTTQNSASITLETET